METGAAIKASRICLKSKSSEQCSEDILLKSLRESGKNLAHTLNINQNQINSALKDLRQEEWK